jgi:hypothetical protein
VAVWFHQRPNPWVACASRVPSGARWSIPSKVWAQSRIRLGCGIGGTPRTGTCSCVAWPYGLHKRTLPERPGVAPRPVQSAQAVENLGQLFGRGRGLILPNQTQMVWIESSKCVLQLRFAAAKLRHVPPSLNRPICRPLSVRRQELVPESQSSARAKSLIADHDARGLCTVNVCLQDAIYDRLSRRPSQSVHQSGTSVCGARPLWFFAT